MTARNYPNWDREKSPGLVFREKMSKNHQLFSADRCVPPRVRVRCDPSRCRKGADTDLRMPNYGAAKIIRLM